MLTRRGWWFLFFLALGTVISVSSLGYYVPILAIFMITLVIWFVYEWVYFACRFRASYGKIHVERSLFQGGRDVPTLWSGVTCEVVTRVQLDTRVRLPFVVATDALPVGCEILEGSFFQTSQLTRDEPVIIRYRWQPASMGRVRFEGVEIRISDMCGLFYRRVFLRDPQEYLILPPLVDEDGGQHSIKRFNSLPPPGIHRVKRAGSGGELLDLRDYIAGDPPKMIAWKASARRDRLITKEFETDVPVRSMLFLDYSSDMRLGEAGKTPLVQMATIASAIAQAASANRDLTGLTTFDNETAQVMKPARTRTHILMLMKRLAEVAGLSSELTESNPKVLQRHAYICATDYYPELLEKEVNSRPFGLFWNPLLDSKWSRWLIIPLLLQPLMFTLDMINFTVSVANSIIEVEDLADIGPFLMILMAITFGPTYIMLIFWFFFGIRGFLPPRSRELSARKQLAAIYCGIDHSKPVMIERYIRDDKEFVLRTRQFLQEHRVRIPQTLFNETHEYRHRNDGKVQTLADALRRSVGVARDNELYILMTNLVELADDLEPLLKSIRMARGRGHSILALIPVPEGTLDTAKLKKSASSLEAMIDDHLRHKDADRYSRVRKMLVQAGANVMGVDARTSVRWVMDRLDRLRGVRTRR